jgi:hypothetical protein
VTFYFRDAMKALKIQRPKENLWSKTFPEPGGEKKYKLSKISIVGNCQCGPNRG